MKGGKMRRWLILALILSVNLLIVGSLDVSRQEPRWDEFIYFDVAENIYEGQGQFSIERGHFMHRFDLHFQRGGG